MVVVDEAGEVQHDTEGLGVGPERVLVEGVVLLEAYVKGRECILSATKLCSSGLRHLCNTRKALHTMPAHSRYPINDRCYCFYHV